MRIITTLLLQLAITTLAVCQQVGINKELPEHTLDVRSTTNDEAAELNISNQDRSRYLRFFSGSNVFPEPAVIMAPGRNLRFASFDDNTLAFNEYMRISSSGDVGIGITNPEARLDILGGDWNLDAGNPGDLRIGNATHSFRIGMATGGGGAGDTRMYTSNASLFIGTNNRPSLVVNKNENVGIGTTTPEARLEIHSAGLSDTLVLLKNSTANGPKDYGLYFNDENGTGTVGASFRADSVGVYGESSAPIGFGVRGRSDGIYGIGVYGESYGSLSAGSYGFSSGSGGYGVYGLGETGVYAKSNTIGGTALYAINSNIEGTNFGVDAITFSPDGAGVRGISEGSSGRGVKGIANGLGGIGVIGEGLGDSGRGVFGQGKSRGVTGYTNDDSGVGVLGEGPTTGIVGYASDGLPGNIDIDSGVNSGVRGRSSGVSSRGVEGISKGFVGRGVYGEGQVGVEGFSSQSGGYGVFGQATGTNGNGVTGEGQTGVSAVTNSSTGTAIKAFSSSATGLTLGVDVTVNSPDGIGVYSTALDNAIYGVSSSFSGRGVRGKATGQNGAGVYGEGKTGVAGRSSLSSGNAIEAINTSTSGVARGIVSYTSSISGEAILGSGNIGIYGVSPSSYTNGKAVQGLASGQSGKAFYGEANGLYGKGIHAKVTSTNSSANAILAEWGGGSSYAGYFIGRVHVNGVLSKASGSFKIDHPLDPENKYLSHSFVESPDMMNIYNGNIRTDESGYATVTLPEYFEALNMEFRYQLTVIGEFAQAIIGEKISGNSFKIRTDKPNVEVSWQVTGVRNDAFAQKNRIKVEEDKEAENIGKYLNAEAFGQSSDKQIGRSDASQVEGPDE
jgi:hypothetical protein